MATLLVMLGLLILPYFLLRPIPGLRARPSLRGCVGLALVFCFTGAGHFLIPKQLAQMIPPFIPYRFAIIYVSGVVEILAGLAVLIPSTRRAAGWFLIVMLLCLLPFNVYAAIERVPLGGHELGPIYLLIRVPLQALLIAWCYWFAVRKNPGAEEI